jgi:flagellin FlaB
VDWSRPGALRQSTAVSSHGQSSAVGQKPTRIKSQPVKAKPRTGTESWWQQGDEMKIDSPSEQRGITGLETAIILIAFVVVASVFAFTVLSTGIFSSERSKETVFAGLQEARSSLEPRGSFVAYKGRAGAGASNDTVYKVSFVVANAVSGEPIDLTPPYSANDTDVDPDIVSGAEYKTVVSFTDGNQHLPDVPWSVEWIGNASADNLLEDGEKAEITVWLLQRNHAVAAATDDNGASGWVADVNGSHGILATGGVNLGVNDQFTIEVKPAQGSVLNIQRTLPSRLDTVMDLK